MLYFLFSVGPQTGKLMMKKMNWEKTLKESKIIIYLGKRINSLYISEKEDYLSNFLYMFTLLCIYGALRIFSVKNLTFNIVFLSGNFSS